MDKHEIYCQKGFLDSLHSKIGPTLRDWLRQNGEFQSLYNMIRHRTELIIDLNKEEFLELCKKNPNYKILLKAGTVDIIPYPETFTQMDQDDYYFSERSKEYYFLNRYNDCCLQLEMNHGLIFLGKDHDSDQLSFLFNQDEMLINKNGSIKDWAFIKEYQHPCNAMIITDNYLLKNQREDDIELNLIQLLVNLIPQKLEMVNEFDLMIITKEVTAINNKYDFIKEKLVQIFPYKFNLSMIQTTLGDYDIHPRNIFTGYLWINSDIGFSIFKQNPVNKSTRCKSDTILRIKPKSLLEKKFGKSAHTEDIPDKKVLDNYNELLAKIKIVVNNAKEPDSHLRLIGSGKNRLLD